MARRRKTNPLSVIAALVLLGLIGWGIEHPSAVLTGFLIVVAGVAAAVILPPFYRSLRAEAERRQRFARISSTAAQHITNLSSMYLRTRRPDGFGGVDEAGWRQSVDYFLRNYVFTEWSEADLRNWRKGAEHAVITQWLTDFVARSAGTRQSPRLAPVDTSQLTPRGYEEYCADILEVAGWDTELTPATRDSGADLIATKGTWRVAVECKRHAQPVGNRAVQQVHAARSLYHANAACVVATGGHTVQAQREALGLGVLLLHDNELADLELALNRVATRSGT